LFDIPIREGNHTSFVRAGFLICYEDIFPGLARRTQELDADLLVVSTNDAWFAEEGCAEQHAAHSVMRAVENHLPVIRCGNAGWSGWIDQQGRVRDVLKNEQGSIYFEGATVLEVQVPIRSFSSRYSMGDQFAYLCLGLFLAILLYYRSGCKKKTLRRQGFIKSAYPFGLLITLPCHLSGKSHEYFFANIFLTQQIQTNVY
jgi:apolipoprotein N-acyltransferase